MPKPNNVHLVKSPTLPRPSRRQFLWQALGLTAAGLTVGGGAAWTKNQLDAGAAAIAQSETLRGQLTDTANAKAALDLSVSGLQAQLLDLQTRFDTVLTYNAELATSLSAAQQETALLQTQLSQRQAELATAQTQIGNSKELLNLYDLLDSTGLDTVVGAGLATVGGGLTAALEVSPLVQDGLTRAGQALTDFETWLPSVTEVVSWVGEQVVKLKVGLMAIELSAQQVVTGLVSGLESVFGGLVKFILEHLPFGMGDNVGRALLTTHTFLNSLPAVAEGLTTSVLGQIAPRVTEGPQHWQHALVEPVRQKALAPTGELLTRVAAANTAFTDSLQTPAQIALAQRVELRQKIAAYRAAHNL